MGTSWGHDTDDPDDPDDSDDPDEPFAVAVAVDAVDAVAAVAAAAVAAVAVVLNHNNMINATPGNSQSTLREHSPHYLQSAPLNFVCCVSRFWLISVDTIIVAIQIHQLLEVLDCCHWMLM